MTKGFFRTALVAIIALVTSAHVGSPNVFFEGMAGDYPVRIVVRPPQVIPGLAEITVRLTGGDAGNVRRVIVRPVYWRTGTAGSPRGDEATRVAGPEPIYQGRLWFTAPNNAVALTLFLTYRQLRPPN
jgi:hypothetical protein